MANKREWTEEQRRVLREELFGKNWILTGPHIALPGLEAAVLDARAERDEAVAALKEVSEAANRLTAVVLAVVEQQAEYRKRIDLLWGKMTTGQQPEQ